MKPSYIRPFFGLLILLLSLPIQVAGQDTHKIVIDTVIHNESSETIDIVFQALENGDPFFEFQEGRDSIRVSETLSNGMVNVFKAPISYVFQDKEITKDKEMWRVKTQSPVNAHKATRIYRVDWMRDGSSLIHGEWSEPWAGAAFNLKKGLGFLDLLVLGLFIGAFVLLLLSELVPILRKRAFFKKYVKPYGMIREDNRRDLNPITGRPIENKELVVSFCNCHIPLEVWQKNGYRCPNFGKECNGVAQIGERQFFGQAGIYRPLNWLWFGIIGGVVAWFLGWVLEKSIPLEESVWQNVFMGAGLGLGLSLMLGWEAERGTWSPESLLWIAVRTLLGGLAAAIIFGLGYKLEVIIGTNWIASPIIWVVFSGVLGIILSIKSTILLKRGLISGLIAGAISAIFFGFFLALLDEAQLARLLAFTLMGGIMGYGIIRVVSRLEEVQLEVLSPKNRQGLIFDLDKILMDNDWAIMGTLLDKRVVQIRIKWEDDFARPQHARFQLRNQEVAIQPIEDAELWIDDAPLAAGKTHILRDGEQIRFARNSPTVLLYSQKATQKNT